MLGTIALVAWAVVGLLWASAWGLYYLFDALQRRDQQKADKQCHQHLVGRITGRKN